LLGLAHNKMYRQIQAELGKRTLSDTDRSLLSVLGTISHKGTSDSASSASAAIKHLVDAARAAEGRCGQGLGGTEMQLLKQLLRKLVGHD
jgi:hypothetical protein